MKTKNIKLVTEHIKLFIDQNPGRVVQNIKRSKTCLSYYDTAMRIAHIPKIIDNARSYWSALHEFGHVDLDHKKPKNWDEEVRIEIEAWNYVKENSVLRIPKSVIDSWEKERIKGSWEKRNGK